MLLGQVKSSFSFDELAISENLGVPEHTILEIDNIGIEYAAFIKVIMDSKHYL